MLDVDDSVTVQREYTRNGLGLSVSDLPVDIVPMGHPGPNNPQRNHRPTVIRAVIRAPMARLMAVQLALMMSHGDNRAPIEGNLF